MEKTIFREWKHSWHTCLQINLSDVSLFESNTECLYSFLSKIYQQTYLFHLLDLYFRAKDTKCYLIKQNGNKSFNEIHQNYLSALPFSLNSLCLPENSTY